MLSKRIIASLVIKDGVAVQSIGFKKYLPIGSPEIAVEYLSAWGADEIIVVEIGAPRLKKIPNLAMIERLSKKSFVPLSVGGGVHTIDTMRALVHGGADKVVLNTAAVENPSLITEGAAIFGSQCIVVSIDAVKKPDGTYEVLVGSEKRMSGLDPVTVAQRSVAAGAGEILIRAVERDGSKQGFDNTLVAQVADTVTVPVIAAGGCGHPAHIHDVLTLGKADAAAVGNMFHFTEHSIKLAKAYLRSNLPVRLDAHVNYTTNPLEEDGRLAKQPPSVLEKLVFEYHPKEII